MKRPGSWCSEKKKEGAKSQPGFSEKSDFQLKFPANKFLRFELALSALREAEAAQAPFDTILIDMQMPVLNGFEATRMLRLRETTFPS